MKYSEAAEDKEDRRWNEVVRNLDELHAAYYAPSKPAKWIIETIAQLERLIAAYDAWLD